MSFDGSLPPPVYDPFHSLLDQEIRPTPWHPSLESYSVPLENHFSSLNRQAQAPTVASDEELLQFFSTQLIQQSDEGTYSPPLIERSSSPFLQEESVPSNPSEHNQDLTVQMTETAQQLQPREPLAPNGKKALPSWPHEGPFRPAEVKQIQRRLIQNTLKKRELRGKDLHHRHLTDLSRSSSASSNQTSNFPPPQKRSSPLSLTETFPKEIPIEKGF